MPSLPAFPPLFGPGCEIVTSPQLSDPNSPVRRIDMPIAGDPQSPRVLHIHSLRQNSGLPMAAPIPAPAVADRDASDGRRLKLKFQETFGPSSGSVEVRAEQDC